MTAGRRTSSPVRPRTAQATAATDHRPVVARVVLHLPVPSSSNAVWSSRKGGGMRLSDAYSAWLTEAGWHLQRQRPGRIAGGYALTLYLPASSRMDLDNAVAGVSDLLQAHGVIGDDRDAEEADLRWHGASDQVVVVLAPFVGPARQDRRLPSGVEVTA